MTPDDPVSVSEAMSLPGSFGARIARELAEMAACAADRCPTCEAPGDCRFAGLSDAGFACRHAADIRAAENRAAAVEARRWRLRCSGCLDPDLVAVASDPEGHGCTRLPTGLYAPPGSWFGAKDNPERLPVRAAYESAAKWEAEPHWRILVLGGGYGAGKSCLAAQLLARATGNTLWVRASVVGTRSWHDRDSDSSPTLAQRAERASLLVLDDWGTERPQYADAVIELLGLRYDCGRRTIATHNHQSIRTVAGDRLASRLAGAGMDVNMGGRDLRTIVRARAS